MSQGFTESIVEQAALAWLESIGWAVRNGVDIAPGEAAAERADYAEVVLQQRLRDALVRLNPRCPQKQWRMPSASSRGPRARSW